jgi:hypothetical protein
VFASTQTRNNVVIVLALSRADLVPDPTTLPALIERAQMHFPQAEQILAVSSLKNWNVQEVFLAVAAGVQNPRAPLFDPVLVHTHMAYHIHSLLSPLCS